MTYFHQSWDTMAAMKRGYSLRPHNPQWSFLQQKDCARYNYMLLKYPELAAKCETLCAECLKRCTENDYVRGMLPPRYPVPAIPSVVEILPNAVFHYTWQDERTEVITYLSKSTGGLWE